MSGGYTKNPNDRDFFSDENINQLFDAEGEDAVYADWMPGVGESAAQLAGVEGRPVGDESTLPWLHGNTVDRGRNS